MSKKTYIFSRNITNIITVFNIYIIIKYIDII